MGHLSHKWCLYSTESHFAVTKPLGPGQADRQKDTFTISANAGNKQSKIKGPVYVDGAIEKYSLKTNAV